MILYLFSLYVAVVPYLLNCLFSAIFSLISSGSSRSYIMTTISSSVGSGNSIVVCFFIVLLLWSCVIVAVIVSYTLVGSRHSSHILRCIKSKVLVILSQDNLMNDIYSIVIIRPVDLLYYLIILLLYVSILL